MYNEIPYYGLRAYALFFSRHGLQEEFIQSDLDWIVGQSMKKKIFSLLVNNGWIKKVSPNSYKCVNPEAILKGLLEFKVPQIIKESNRPYAFTGLSAILIGRVTAELALYASLTIFSKPLGNVCVNGPHASPNYCQRY